MEIREARHSDAAELQHIMAHSPWGANLIMTLINTPDFFARVKAYETAKVFVVQDEHGRIAGSAACAIRDLLVDGVPRKAGYEFQYFTSPDHRRQGVARKLRQHIERYLISEGVELTSAIIGKENAASIGLFEREGFGLHRDLLCCFLLVYQHYDMRADRIVRPARLRDLGAIAGLLNETWADYDFYEPVNAISLARFIDRTPEYSLDNLLVLEDELGEIVACAGIWDWSRIMQIEVKAVDPKMRVMNWMMDLARLVRPMPRSFQPGSTLKQWGLTPIGFDDPGHLATLLRYINNHALQHQIEQVGFICEPDNPLLQSMTGFSATDINAGLYVKSLGASTVIGARPVFVDMIDL